jgi:hypothetical protein
VSYHWRGGQGARGLDLRPEPPKPPPEPPWRSTRAGRTIDRKYEEPWSGQLPTRIMVLTSELPRVPGRWRGDLIMTGDRPREFLQLSDGSYVRVTSTDDGELMPAGEPVSPQRARSRSASTAVAFSSHVVADAPGCGLCTWSPRDGRWALKFVNQACVLHRDDQVEHG